ncbi:MAG: hypothetical protein EOP84_11690, partial [Verrucomicrobiaceae bacterium]
MKISLPQFVLRRRWLTATCALFLLSVLTVAIRSRAGQRSATVVSPEGSLTATVVTGPFLREVMERGEVQSSSNVEVRCQVPSRGA